VILTVTLNPAVDDSIVVPSFHPGGVQRVHRSSRRAGGKGVNVARALAALGHDVIAVGLCGGPTGRFLLSALEQEGLPHQFISTTGDTRTSRTIIDPESGVDTHLIESGPTVSNEEWSAFSDLFGRLSRQAEVVALCGSLPPGLPETTYAELIAVARTCGAMTALDSRGAALRQGAAALPDVLKPNDDELAELCGWASGRDEETASQASKLLGRAVLVTLGADGALLVTADGAWRATLPAVDSVNTVGSGDAALAGLLSALVNGSDQRQALRLAMGCGMANAASDGPGLFDVAEARRMGASINVSPLG